MASDKIFLVGFMGSGKSTFGKQLAKQIGWDFVDLDDYIEEKEKRTITEIFASDGEDYFRQLETSVLFDTKTWEKTVVSCGGGTPCFNNNVDVINDLGLSIYMKLSPQSLKDRLIKEKAKRPLIANLKDAELLNFISGKLAERCSFYESANLIFEYSNEKETEFIKTIFKKIV